MIFLGISLMISAAIIAATFLYLFKTAIKLYKEMYDSLFKENNDRDKDPVKETDESIKFGGF